MDALIAKFVECTRNNSQSAKPVQNEHIEEQENQKITEAYARSALTQQQLIDILQKNINMATINIKNDTHPLEKYGIHFYYNLAEDSDKCILNIEGLYYTQRFTELHLKKPKTYTNVLDVKKFIHHGSYTECLEMISHFIRKISEPITK